MSLGPGTRLGPYEVIAAISAGGIGEVYRARDTRLDRTVAIKVLPAAVANDPTFRERFDREARAVATVSPDGQRFLIITRGDDRRRTPAMTVLLNWANGVRR